MSQSEIYLDNRESFEQECFCRETYPMCCCNCSKARENGGHGDCYKTYFDTEEGVY